MEVPRMLEQERCNEFPHRGTAVSYAMAKIDRQMQIAASGVGNTSNDKCSTSIALLQHHPNRL